MEFDAWVRYGDQQQSAKALKNNHYYMYSDGLYHVLAGYPLKTLTADGQVLARHLLSRRSPSRVEESQRRKGELRVVSGLWQHHSS